MTTIGPCSITYVCSVCGYYNTIKGDKARDAFGQGKVSCQRCETAMTYGGGNNGQSRVTREKRNATERQAR
jgi:DNA polymerase III alpha subunit (gram-positive type)